MGRLLNGAVAIPMVAWALCGIAQQDHGSWQPASTTAASITGDISISNSKLTIDLKGFPLSSIRALKPAEVSAVFDVDLNTGGVGTLYRISVPGQERFLHKNTLCGTEETRWMATYAAGKALKVAFFSGEAEPMFTFDAVSHSPDLCGAYTYVR